MKVKDIKQYIMTVLIHKSEELAVSPDLIIDRLFDNLNLDTLQEIEGFSRSATGSSNDVKQIVWDRYLVPTQMMAEMHVKVFARD